MNARTNSRCHYWCACGLWTRALHLLWSPPQEGFKALLGASICRSSARFWSWDILSPFTVKVIESHINLAQKYLIVKARSVVTDQKSQGKYWSALLSSTSGWLWKPWHTELLDHFILSLCWFFSLCEWPIVWQDPLKSPETLKPVRSTSAFV